MGAFYAKRIKHMLKKPPVLGFISGDPVSVSRAIDKLHERDKAYRALLIEKCGEVEELVVELLDFQEWT